MTQAPQRPQYSKLEAHRFSVTVTENLKGGRPSFFYDRMGIVKAFMLANTPLAKEFGPNE